MENQSHLTLGKKRMRLSTIGGKEEKKKQTQHVRERERERRKKRKKKEKAYSLPPIPP